MISLQNAIKTSGVNFKKRVKNIKFFAALDRTELEYEVNEKNPEIFSIRTESVSIKYPGKETKGWNLWDFRPILKVGEKQIRNLSFSDIWRAMDNFVNSIPDIGKQEASILLARILYKVTYFNAHTEIIYGLYYGDEDINPAENTLYVFDKTKLSESEQSLFSHSIEVDNENISLESFIVYNDLLCSNEDLKYFFKSYIEKREETEQEKLVRNRVKGKKKRLYKLKKSSRKPKDIIGFNPDTDSTRLINWEPTTGRINTFLTHINILKFIHDEQDPYDLLADSAIKRGVFQIKNDAVLIDFLNQNIEV